MDNFSVTASVTDSASSVVEQIKAAWAALFAEFGSGTAPTEAVNAAIANLAPSLQGSAASVAELRAHAQALGVKLTGLGGRARGATAASGPR